jgi:hypothetical protein
LIDELDASKGRRRLCSALAAQRANERPTKRNRTAQVVTPGSSRRHDCAYYMTTPNNTITEVLKHAFILHLLHESNFPTETC